MLICSDCDIEMFHQISANGVQVTGPLASNTSVTYECADPTNFFIRGMPTSNMCDNSGMYASTTAPTCERGKHYNHTKSKYVANTLERNKFLQICMNSNLSYAITWKQGNGLCPTFELFQFCFYTLICDSSPIVLRSTARRFSNQSLSGIFRPSPTPSSLV